MKFWWLEMFVAIVVLLWKRYALKVLHFIAFATVIAVCALVYYGHKTACPGHGPFNAPFVKCKDF